MGKVLSISNLIVIDKILFFLQTFKLLKKEGNRRRGTECFTKLNLVIVAWF